MDPYRAFAYPVRIIKEVPTYPVGGMIIVGKDDNFLSLYNLNTDKNINSVFKGNTNITGYDLPDGVDFGGVEEAEGAFMGCTALQGFRSGVTFKELRKGKQLFNGCTALVNIPPSITFDNLEDGEEMFTNCTALKSIPAGVTMKSLKNIECMFAGCTLLRDVPDTLDLASIGMATFPSQKRQMFSGCYLSAQSVKNVLNALPVAGEFSIFDIGFTHNDERYDPDPVDWRNDEEIAAMLNTTTPIDYHRSNYYDTDKGWRIFIDG